MRSFLGSIGYYRQFIEGYCKLSAVLLPAIRQDAPNKVHWDQRMVDAFDQLRYVLCNVCCLHVPVEGDLFMLQTDASGSGSGSGVGGVCGVLNVTRNGEVLPVGFYARQL